MDVKAYFEGQQDKGQIQGLFQGKNIQIHGTL